MINKHVLATQLALLSQSDSQDEYTQEIAMDKISIAMGDSVIDMDNYLTDLSDTDFMWVAATFYDIAQRIHDSTFLPMIQHQALLHPNVDISQDIEFVKETL
jgi:hypothetical protein